MTVREAECQLDRMEQARGVRLTNRTRHLILRAVAAEVFTVGVHGLEDNLNSNAGLMAAAALLHFHPTAWLEAIPEELASSAATEMPIEEPRFGL